MQFRMQVIPAGLHRLRHLRERLPRPRTKALVMKPLDTQREEQENWRVTP